MIVRKSIRMAEALKTPILGIVENMRSLICPKCGEEIELFDLYYGKQYGLSVKSEYNTGTCVTLVIPAKKDDGTQNDNPA